MSESEFSKLSTEDLLPIPEQNSALANDKQRKISRRKLLKTASATAVSLPLGILVGRGMVGVGEDAGLIKINNDNFQDKVNQTKGNEIETNNEDPFIKDIESRLGIRLLSLREAYEAIGREFDEYNTEEFGDTLPMRWDHERASMLEKFFGYLPEYFHEHDGKGDPLIISLTNYGTIPVAGDYFADPIFNLMRLDMDVFSPTNMEGAFHLLTHESIHHLQDLGYSRLDNEITKLFRNDIKAFCKDTIDRLNAHPRFESEEDVFFREMLRYGVQDIFNEEDPLRARDSTIEFEAVLGEFYVHGEEFFESHMHEIYGDKAKDLYQYMRDNVFGGMEYNSFPIESIGKDESKLEEGARFMNEVINDFIYPKVIEEGVIIPSFKANHPNLVRAYEKGLFTFKEDFQPIPGEKGEIKQGKRINASLTSEDGSDYIGAEMIFEVVDDHLSAVLMQRLTLSNTLQGKSIQELAQSYFKFPPGVVIKFEEQNGTEIASCQKYNTVYTLKRDSRYLEFSRY